MTAVCSPWWPLVRGWSRGRAAHFGGGRRVAPSDESRLVRLSLLRDVEVALEAGAALEPRGPFNSGPI